MDLYTGFINILVLIQISGYFFAVFSDGFVIQNGRWPAPFCQVHQAKQRPAGKQV